MMQPSEDRLSPDFTSLEQSMPIHRSRPGQGPILNYYQYGDPLAARALGSCVGRLRCDGEPTVSALLADATLEIAPSRQRENRKPRAIVRIKVCQDCDDVLRQRRSGSDGQLPPTVREEIPRFRDNFGATRPCPHVKFSLPFPRSTRECSATGAAFPVSTSGARTAGTRGSASESGSGA
jgi:hypothetical protein